MDLACNGMADGMHAEANYGAKWSKRINMQANAIDVLEDKTLDTKYGIGKTQAAFHDSISQKGIGHGRYAEGFRNEKSQDAGKRSRGQLRYTGGDVITVMKNIGGYINPLAPDASAESGLEAGEPGFDFELRLRMRLEMILVARMSDVYSRYRVTAADVINLKKAGFYLLDLWKIAGRGIGLNDTTIAIAIPESMKKFFNYFRTGDGSVALGGASLAPPRAPKQSTRTRSSSML